MNGIDWGVLFGTLAFIVLYGTWKTRRSETIESYLRGDNASRWWMMGISVMATQASAITFLSTPGLAYEEGMRFLQFYFGLPLAMVIISVAMVPIYYKLKVFTAYEYLESRFDLKTRALGAGLFLIQRGLAAGITLFAPSLVLSTILGWPTYVTTIMIGTLVIVYVVSGGTKAVSLTQRYQMSVIMGGMILAGILALLKIPDNVSFGETVQIAGEMGKLNLINLEFNLNDRYNIWSGLIAGAFLSLSYFGTDQSQVARYLSGTSITESRLGLLFNGLLKVPMQFVILFIGVLVYVFYLFNQPPVFHNTVLKERAMQTASADSIRWLEADYDALYQTKREAVDALVVAIEKGDTADIRAAGAKVRSIESAEILLRDSVRNRIHYAIPSSKPQDHDYVFLNFVLTHLPNGIIGLLLAVMFSAAMSSMAGELNALASTSTVDVYRRLIQKQAEPIHYVHASRWFTALWAILAITFALLANFAENLIEFVNIVGSLFYGTILGIFLVGFFVRRVGATAVFWAGVVSEVLVLCLFKFTDIAYLHFNIIGCAGVIILSLAIEEVLRVTRSGVSK